jgi:hypothetical protein
VERGGNSACAASETPGWRSFSAGLTGVARCFPSGVISGRGALERGCLSGEGFPSFGHAAQYGPNFKGPAICSQTATALCSKLSSARLFPMRLNGLYLKSRGKKKVVDTAASTDNLKMSFGFQSNFLLNGGLCVRSGDTRWDRSRFSRAYGLTSRAA